MAHHDKTPQLKSNRKESIKFDNHFEKARTQANTVKKTINRRKSISDLILGRSPSTKTIDSK